MRFIFSLFIAAAIYSCSPPPANCPVNENQCDSKIDLKDLEIFMLHINAGINSWINQERTDSQEKAAYQKQINEIYPALKEKLKKRFPAKMQTELIDLFKSIDELIMRHQTDVTSVLTKFEDYENPAIFLPVHSQLDEINLQNQTIIQKIHGLQERIK